MATASAYSMNPFSQMPAARQRQSNARLVDLSAPPLEQNFVVAGPGAAFEMAPDAEVVKPLRGEKEPLPEADFVDPAQILSSSAAFARDGAAAAPAAPAPGTDTAGCRVDVEFDGGFFGNPTTIPPDTHGAPGPEAVLTMLNNRVLWHDRNGAVLRDVTLDAFWNVFDQPIDTFDPKVFFDALTGRFIAVVCGDARTPQSAVLIAVSKSSDPLGEWVFGRIAVDDDTMNGLWLDYPSVGFTDDKITVCLNLFTNQANEFRGVAVFVVDKPAFLNAPHNFVFDQFVISDQGGTLCPAIACDAGITDQYLVSTWSGNDGGKGFLALFQITGNVANDDTSFRRVGFLEVDQTWRFRGGGDFAPQQGTAIRIDAGDARMQWVVHRHGRLYLAHSVYLPVGAPTRSAVQWAEVILEGDPSVSDHGLIEDMQNGRFFSHPSLAVNDQGDVLIGMSAFSATMFASGAYAFRPSGGIFTAPVIYALGGNRYNLTLGGSGNRWGDYSATHVDPANGRDFWTIQEYADAVVDRWRTRWARIAVGP